MTLEQDKLIQGQIIKDIVARDIEEMLQEKRKLYSDRKRPDKDYNSYLTKP